MNDRSIARWRLHTQRLAGRSFSSPTEAVQGLLAVQAENPAQAPWAVAARTPGTPLTQFNRLLDDGVILRTHVLRPTWHYVLPDDIRWLVELTAPRIKPLADQFQKSLGIPETVIEQGQQVVADALSGGLSLTRRGLAERLSEAGLPGDGDTVGLVISRAELAALVCSGPMQGNQPTFALLAERAPSARQLDRDEALAELVLRYFTGHGPATERDLAYWATLTLTDVRRGLAAVQEQLDHFEHEGRIYWYGQPPPPDGALEPAGHLLQILDEYHHGYQDSRHTLDVEGAVPKGRSANMGMALVDGQMVGGMRRKLSSRTATFGVALFRELSQKERTALDEAAKRYGQFLQLQPRLVLTDAT